MTEREGGERDWRRSLRELFSTVEGADVVPGGERPRVKKFIAEVVVPAFEELAEELQEHGRDVEVRFGDRKATIQVNHEGDEEFFYAVEASPYRKKDFSFPVLPLRDAEGQTYRAEARLRTRPLHEDVTDYSRAEIIESVLREYERKLRWDL